MIGEKRPLLPKIVDQTDRVGAKSPIFDLFSLVATQTQRPAKKVQLTLTGCTYALSNEPKMNIVRCL